MATTGLDSTQLFARAMNLVIGSPTDPTMSVQAQFNDQNSTGTDLSGFDVEFHVEKSLKPTEPNTLQLQIYNLAPASRQQLSGASKLTVKLEAGYAGGLSQLYFAEARSAWTTRDGPDYITHIESTDTIASPAGGVQKTKKILPGSSTGSLNRTLGARVPLGQAIQAIANVMGVKPGNLAQFIAGTRALQAVNGSALVGNVARRMTDLCRSAGLEWSIQDGALQILNVGQTLSTTQAILLSSTDTNTGLIGSPSVDSRGALSLETLLIPGLAPGVLIKVDSLFVQGGYRIEKIRYVGNTRGQEWYARIEAAKY